MGGDHLGPPRIAVSKLCVETITRHISAEFEIIPNGVDLEYFSKPKGQLNKYKDGKINILFVGRLDPRNGLECLIKAYRQARKKNRNIRLIIIGDGPLRSYYNIIMKDEDDIHFEGYVNHLRPDYYLNCDIFCFPVQKASFGITILEAMAASKPIICTDLPAFHDILGKDQKACRYVDPFDPQAFADKLTELIEDASLRQTMGEVGFERVQRFSWPQVTKQVLEYYQKILATTGS
ncbi:MAG: glycosyltransferase family 4 protein [Proteobacteria bacterium]|nr:glycosyltransferase family 4 protein [Pseudomonadota bacterium]